MIYRWDLQKSKHWYTSATKMKNILHLPRKKELQSHIQWTVFRHQATKKPVTNIYQINYYKSNDFINKYINMYAKNWQGED